jgi:hypothetical protein
VLTKAEFDIRGAAQPRYHLEIALLRWMYLRKLVSIEELIAGTPIPASAPRPSPAPASSAPSRPATTQAPPATPLQRKADLASRAQAAAPQSAAPKPAAKTATADAPVAGAGFKDALLAEIRSAKVVFYSTVVAQAQRIDVAADRVTFTFSSAQRALRDALEQNRTWLETLAQQLGGRKISVVGVQAEATGRASVVGESRRIGREERRRPQVRAARTGDGRRGRACAPRSLPG